MLISPSSAVPKMSIANTILGWQKDGKKKVSDYYEESQNIDDE